MATREMQIKVAKTFKVKEAKKAMLTKVGHRISLVVQDKNPSNLRLQFNNSTTVLFPWKCFYNDSRSSPF